MAQVWLWWLGCPLQDPTPTTDPLGSDPSAQTIPVSILVRPGVRDLVATVDMAEEELPNLEYEWRVNGTIWPAVGDRVPATDVWPGQRWTLVVRDGSRQGSDEVTVPAPPTSNVLLVLLDDVGVDKLAAYNPLVTPVPTPTIDGLAAEGVVFDHAFSSPLCGPTRANLLTGRYGRRTGMGFVPDIDEKLPYGEVTIAEILAQARDGAQWTSVALGKWNLAGNWVSRDHPNAHGFSHYSGVFTFLSENWVPYNSYYSWEETTNGVDVGRSTTYNTTAHVDDAIEQLDILPEPWFLYLPLNAAHEPFDVPPPELHTQPLTSKSSPAEVQRSILEAADHELGRLLASMTPEVRANTTIILTADNGTAPTAVEPPYNADESKHTVYEGGVHVPLIIAGPLVTQPGSRSDALVHLVDVFPTMADVAGVPLVDLANDDLGLPLSDGTARPIDGLSLLPYLEDPSTPSQRDDVYVEQFFPNGPGPYTFIYLALRTHTHTLVRNLDVIELYDRVPGAADDGTNLLEDGTSAEEQVILDDLYARLTLVIESTPYDGTWDE